MEIDNLKKYLNDWISLDNYPPSFMDIEFKDYDNLSKKIKKYSFEKDFLQDSIQTPLDAADIVYILGVYFYYHLTHEKYNGELIHKNIKKPKIYQFLNMILEKDKENRVSNPNILLSILTTNSDRDCIEQSNNNQNYTIESFSTLGLTRVQNQDYLGTLQLKNALALIVADGVGGAESGEIASKMAVEYAIATFENNEQLLEEDSDIIKSFLRDMVFKINKKVLDYTIANNLDKMGTTLSIALIINHTDLYIVHIGDSRIYELEKGREPRKITEDHSYPEVMHRLGKIHENQKSEYKKNILVYVIGKDNLKKEDIFVQNSTFYNGTKLLLCSDGFWEKIDVSAEIFEQDFDELKSDIFDTVPTDNVTVIRFSPNKTQIEQSEEIIFEEYVSNETSIYSKEIKDTKDNEKKIISKNNKQITNEVIVSNKNYSIPKKNYWLISIVLILSFILLGVYIYTNHYDTSPYLDKNILEKKSVIDSNASVIDSNIVDFFRYIDNQDIEQVKKSLDELGVDVNITDKNNHTALYYANKNYNLPLIKLLINKGIDRNNSAINIDEDINSTKKILKELNNKLKNLKKIKVFYESKL